MMAASGLHLRVAPEVFSPVEGLDFLFVLPAQLVLPGLGNAA